MTIRMLWATMLATTCLWPVSVLADGPLPTDPDVISGYITISTPSATQMLLMQAGAYGIVDWGSFSIDQGFGVQFQNGAGATLNRVTGSDLSSIMGQLGATGSVYLINQNGIVFGQDGVVNTGGTFVASTLDIDNGDFLDGGDATFRGDSNGYVINLGYISALGGEVAILAHTVVNEGSISAPNGTVGLAVGREILMRDAAVADGLFSVKIGGDDTSVTDSGAIRAAAAELRANGGNVYALAGNTGGVIAATGMARVNGRVFLTAGPTGSVTVDKTVKATEVDGRGGTITVDGGTVDMTGVLDASGSRGGDVRITSDIATLFSGQVLAFGNGTAGSGGFAEVSGRHLTFGGTVQTRGGTLLIDPDNIEIGPDGAASLDGASLFFASVVSDLLGTQNVIFETTGTDGEAGTIAVTSAIEWSSAFGLSLLAHGDVLFAANVLGSDGANGLNVVAGWDGSTSTTAFDPAAFLAADLVTTTLFGNDDGVGYIFDGGIFAASGSVVVLNAQVGVASGATSVFANGVGIGGTGSTGFSQLGFNQTGASGITPSGDIVVRATGTVSVIGGDGGDAGAQIGHVGVDFTGSSEVATVNASGAIRIEAGGEFVLAGGGDDNSYAMIGHGSRDFFSFRSLGGRSGAITITAAGEASIASSSGPFSRDAWIGHAAVGDAISAADITVTALNFDEDRGTLVGAGGTGTLDIGMLAETSLAGTVTYRATDDTALAGLNLVGQTGSLSCECDFVNTLGDIVIQSAGDLLLDTSFFFSNTGGGNLALAAGRNFHNNSGVDAFGTMTGFWRIFSTRPDENTGDIGTLTNLSVYTEAVFDPADPFALPRANVSAGNALLYTKVPLVTIGDSTMTYGGSLVLPGTVVTVDGVEVDPALWGFAIAGTFVDDGVATFSSSGFINAGLFVDALDFNWTPVTSITGDYDFLFVDKGTLTVDRATLTGSIIGSPTKVYDGNDIATLISSDFLLEGFIEGEGAIVTQTAGTYASANAADEVQVSVTLTAGDVVGESLTDMANYTLPAAVLGLGTITPATLTAALTGPITKVYDGNTTATLTAADFLLSGFVGSERADVTQTSGLYRGSDAAAVVGVDVELSGTDFEATGTTLLSNYVLPTSATGTGSIDQATLIASIIGTPTKVYDGTTDATLTASNFLLSGFASGQGGTISASSGTYASANASGTNLVTVALTGSDIQGDSSTTLLSNYVLPTTATGNGVITQATLTGSIIGTPTKAYDGTTAATLSAANFLLEGFVGTEGATVTAETGTYASANVTGSGSNLVTVALTSGDFAVTGDTLLTNYVLPTTVTGNGAITRALLVSGVVVGTPTKVYDGTTVATLTAANFLLSGFAEGEGATVTQTAGTYASANASGTNLVTVTLAAGDFTASGETLLSNYDLPTTVSGNGAITQATLSSSIIGTPNKVYDGTTLATLTSANFLLSGFVEGEGATVTETVGTFGSANAATSNLVTVALDAGDFSATEGTLLANYLLPTTASGAGAIDRAVLTASVIGLPTKPFDGTVQAILTPANFSLVGFVAGEGATVTQTEGSYATATAGVANVVTVNLAAGDFAASGETLLANYILPDTATGPGLVDLAPPIQPEIPQTRSLDTFTTTPLGEPSGPATGIEVISTETTQRILDEIRAGSAFCKALIRQEYVIDCLSDRLQSVADSLSAVGEYSEVRAAMEDAAQQLHALALANASSELASQVVRAGGRRSSRPLTAVSSEALGTANAQASAIIETAQLVLLRSSSGSAQRSVAFTQVAQVVNSTKVLLRSS